MRGVRCATNRTIFVAGLGRCARHGGWPKRFLRRGRRGGMARRVADRTLRSDVTGGRPRAVVLAIVRRGSCDCALRLMLEEGTKRTNRKRAPARTGGGRVFWDGVHPVGRSHAAVHAVMRCGSCVRAPLDMRPRCCFGDRAALAFAIVRCGHFQRKERNGQTETRPPPVRAGGARFGTGRIRSGVWPDFLRRRGRRGDGGAACGVRLTGLFSWRGGARCGRHTARALAVRGRPAAWRGVWLTGLCAAM